MVRVVKCMSEVCLKSGLENRGVSLVQKHSAISDLHASPCLYGVPYFSVFGLQEEKASGCERY